MTEHLHTATITGTEDRPRIEFRCAGDRTAECHQYPDCRCESWVRGEHEHPFVSHDECWLVSWFDNADDGGVEPMPEYLSEGDITPGMSGPIKTHFTGDYVEWEFIEEGDG
ncbi:hypothetical protein [Nocardia otitidiscaviarum]|uniref:hypothetical protein n=1 Tax=Nocardia otitidiscaviarum TaxID=1823 RepID=UPI0004A6C036|nr:hypothetical protein [Nocardia otitidiscaviarum]